MLATVTLFLVTGCATNDLEEVPKTPPPEQVFRAPYEQVWRATQLAMSRYPRKIDDQESGVLETETQKGDRGWQPAFDKAKRSSGYRQFIRVLLIKGHFDGQPAVRVVVNKQIELLRSFFNEPEKLESDRFEEKMILYRIERELKIEQAIQRSVKRKTI